MEDLETGKAPDDELKQSHSLLRQLTEENYSLYENCLSLFPDCLRYIIIAFKIIFPCFLIVVGIRFRDDCSVNTLIPIFFLVLGFLFGIKQLLFLTTFVRQSKEKQTEEVGRQSRTQLIINLFIVSVLGVLTYSVYTQNQKTDINCNQTVYLVTYWSLTIFYVIASIIGIFLILASIIILIFSKKQTTS